MELRLIGPYIKLGQAIKAAHLVSMGSEAKEEILSGNVFVNGEPETRRGKKLVPGDVVTYRGETITIVL